MTQDTIEDGVSVWIIPLGIQNANQAGKVFPDRERLIHIMSGIWPRRKQLKILGGAMQDWMSLPLDRINTPRKYGLELLFFTLFINLTCHITISILKVLKILSYQNSFSPTTT